MAVGGNVMPEIRAFLVYVQCPMCGENMKVSPVDEQGLPLLATDPLRIIHCENKHCNWGNVRWIFNRLTGIGEKVC